MKRRVEDPGTGLERVHWRRTGPLLTLSPGEGGRPALRPQLTFAQSELSTVTTGPTPSLSSHRAEEGTQRAAACSYYVPFIN